MTNFEKFYNFEIEKVIAVAMDLEDCYECPANEYCCRLKEDRSCSKILAEWLTSEYKKYHMDPCPFCGGDTILFINTDHDEVLDENELYGGERVACCCSMGDGGCGASSGYFDTREEAVRHWNRRA